MRTNLFQIRGAFLRTTVLWAFLGAIAAFEPPALLFALVYVGVAALLYASIPPNGDGAAAAAHTLAAMSYAAATMAALLLAARVGLPPGWPWLVPVALAWTVTTAAGLRLFSRLVTIPPGVMYVYNSVLGPRRVSGYAKVAPPLRPFERLQVVVPTGRRRLDVKVAEVGTLYSAPPATLGRRVDDRGPPRGAPAICNVHRIKVGVEYSLDQQSFFRVLSVPRNDIVSRERAEWGGGGRKEWHEPRFWAGVAGGYLGELADELTREVVHRAGWSAEEVWRRKAELAERLAERLAEHAALYGIVVHEVSVADVMVDEPSALRRSRDLELFGAMWQRQQADVLENFHHTLTRLGLQLTPQEIESLTRIHFQDMVRHLQQYGHLEFIVQELVGGPPGPQAGPARSAPRRRAA